MAFRRTVKDIMSEPVVTTSGDAMVTDVIKLLLRWHISGLPVVDEDARLIGIVTEHDIMNLAISGNASDTRVREIMITDIEARSSDTLVEEAVNLFATGRFRRVPVVEDGRVLGVISRRDVIRELNRMYSQLVATEDIETADAVWSRLPLESRTPDHLVPASR